MAELTDRFQPSFNLFPINNNRTGYQPVNLPIVLTIPYRRTADGFPVGNTDVLNLKFYVEEAPQSAKVATIQNRGILVPNYERFKIDIDNLQLSEVSVGPADQEFIDQTSGDAKSYTEVEAGDLMQYGLLRGPLGANGASGVGVIDTIPYHQDIDYYDLSPFIIETYDLPPGHYRFVWQCEYYERVVTDDNEVICLDTTKLSVTRIAIDINHPGEIHEAMISNTPAFYFDGPRIDKDNTIAFYRPFADMLQDIFDEQKLLHGLNWVDKIPIQYVPYLSYLIGFDLPYFPTSTDNIRRSLLRNGKRLQQLKGSRRAIRELFEIFGFTIDLANLWYSADGTRFIAPDEKLPSAYADQKITTATVCHTEPVLNNYTSSGFGQIEIPLLFRPLGNITIDAYLVEADGAVQTALDEAIDLSATDTEHFSSSSCAVSVDGFQTNGAVSIPSGSIGHSTVLIDPDRGSIAERQLGSEPVINSHTVTYDFDRNVLKITFDHYMAINKTAIYALVTYERTKIILPAVLNDLRSNRFDINILTFKDGGIPSSDLLGFLIEFLFRFKAFHSLLRKITYRVELDDIYNVQDFCLGGQFGQEPGTSLGEAQLPPAIIPEETSENVCSNIPANRGFKDSDLAYRNRIRRLLEEEHATWKALDGSHTVPSDLLPLLQSLSRVTIRQSEGEDCQFTQYGQDRVLSSNQDLDHSADEREKLCDTTDNVSDYCYKGRVGQEVATDQALICDEIFRLKPCTLSGGVGAYYLTPIILNNELSGREGADLTKTSNINRSWHDKSFVRTMAYPNADLHYTDRYFLDDLEDAVNNRFSAIRRPSLEIEKDNMGIPGHRFISMANQEMDFVHPVYYFRPWDDAFDVDCPEDILDGSTTLSDLNPQLIQLTSGQNNGSQGFGVLPFGGAATPVAGDEYLAFQQIPITYYGNGIKADIPVMDDHTVSDIDPNYVAHSIWSSASPGLSWSRGDTYGDNYQVVVDQKLDEEDSVRYPIEALGVDKDTICFTDVLSPIFESANRTCPCPSGSNAYTGESLDNVDARNRTSGATVFDLTSANITLGADYIDGYPADFGQYTVDLSDYDFPRATLGGYGISIYGVSLYGAAVGGGTDIDDLAIAMGIPLDADPIVRRTFKIGSGIRVSPSESIYHLYKPYRLDCGCSMYDCEPSVTGSSNSSASDTTPSALTVVRCTQSFFENNDGSYDWNHDRVEANLTLGLNDAYGAKSIMMDGTIPNMMSFDPVQGIVSNPIDGIPSEGRFQFIDDYGVIYIGMFETFNDRIDYTLQVKDPRVPGSLIQTGEVINWKVFRDGVISSERQIIQSMEDGFTVVAEGYEQRVARFQTTFGCGDDTYNDPFEYHLDHDITDDVSLIVTDVVGTGAGDSTEFGGDSYGYEGFGE